MYNKCLPVVVSAATVLALTVLNPELLQKKQNGQSMGYPDGKWLALAALVAGLGTCLVMEQLKVKKF